MGVTVGWPATAVLGFLVLTGLVVALATSSTARYEFERNGAREAQRSAAQQSGTHPAGSRLGSWEAGATETQARPHAVDAAVDVAVRPGPAPAGRGPGWWLVDDSAQAVAGPFADRIDADWAALADDLPVVAVFGARHADGTVAPRPSPEERAWLSDLGDQLDRLPRDWDELLSDTDPLTTLVVEVAAALIEAGLPLHDPQGSPAGGVCLMPDTAFCGVVVSWRGHDRMTVHQLRGAAADATIQQSMNAAIADVLANLGFVLEPVGGTGGSLVTALG
ncbi:hypothetical protein [Blastococcus haudaquaticus]|nr:hypothetical protein [Blastococcus haudaquaticus]